MTDEVPGTSGPEIERFLQQWAPSKKETGYAELLRRLNLLSPEIIDRDTPAD
jgi:hypothetical protein